MRRQGGVVRLWGFGLHSVLCVLEGAGDGRSGALLQDLFGTYADTCGIGGCPAVPFTHALGDLPTSRASLRKGFLFSASALDRCAGQLSTRGRHGGNGVPPMITTAESRRGSKALIPVTPGRTISQAVQMPAS